MVIIGVKLGNPSPSCLGESTVLRGFIGHFGPRESGELAFLPHGVVHIIWNRINNIPPFFKHGVGMINM